MPRQALGLALGQALGLALGPSRAAAARVGPQAERIRSNGGALGGRHRAVEGGARRRRAAAKGAAAAVGTAAAAESAAARLRVGRYEATEVVVSVVPQSGKLDELVGRGRGLHAERRAQRSEGLRIAGRRGRWRGG